MRSSIVAERAYPKVNLSLHVTGRRADGYHLLESLVVFADCGDSLAAEPAEGLSLSISGPFGDGLSAGGDNLVLRAALMLREAAGIDGGAALHLRKSLPIASGIGGGSADAAAALRLLNRMWRLDWPEARLEELGLALGADVPVCIGSRTRMLRGIGERLGPGPDLPELWMVLANPLRAVATPAVFAARGGAAFTQSRIVPARFGTASELVEWLSAHTANDLAAPARQVQPAIAEVEAALSALPDALLSRMSGSGATCFAIFENEAQAEAAATILREEQPAWWCEVARVAEQGRAAHASRRCCNFLADMRSQLCILLRRKGWAFRVCKSVSPKNKIGVRRNPVPSILCADEGVGLLSSSDRTDIDEIFSHYIPYCCMFHYKCLLANTEPERDKSKYRFGMSKGIFYYWSNKSFIAILWIYNIQFEIRCI